MSTANKGNGHGHGSNDNNNKQPDSPPPKLCRVCGDSARAFNYNGLSCEACKVFFRRNAPLRDELECRTAVDGYAPSCSVSGVYGRQSCPKCRLERCFAIGMTKAPRIYTSHGRRIVRRTLPNTSSPPKASSSSSRSNTSTNINNSNTPTNGTRSSVINWAHSRPSTSKYDPYIDSTMNPIMNGTSVIVPNTTTTPSSTHPNLERILRENVENQPPPPPTCDNNIIDNTSDDVDESGHNHHNHSSIIVRPHQLLQRTTGRPEELGPLEQTLIQEVMNLIGENFPEETSLTEITPPYRKRGKLLPSSTMMLNYGRRWMASIRPLTTFGALPMPDQLLLLQSTFIELILLRFFFAYDPIRDGCPAIINEGSEATFLPFTKLEYIPNREVVHSIRTYTVTLNQAMAKDTWVRNLLSSMTLFHLDPECGGVARNGEAIQYELNRYQWLLKRYLRQKHNIQDGDRRYDELMAAYGGLRSAKKLVKSIIEAIGVQTIDAHLQKVFAQQLEPVVR